MVDSPYGSDYYLDESGRKDSARFILNQLYEATGIPAFKRYRQAVVSGDNSSVGALNRNTALVEALAGAVGLGSFKPLLPSMTTKELEKGLGKVVSSHLRMVPKKAEEDAARAVKYGYEANLADRVNLYRTKIRGAFKNTLADIRSAPEALFDPVKSVETGDLWYGGAIADVGSGSIKFDPAQVKPQVLRHELSHLQQAANDRTKDLASEFYGVGRRAHREYGRNVDIHDYMTRKLGSWYKGSHDLIPAEINAEQMESIPLSLFKDVDQYRSFLEKHLKSAFPEGVNRMKALERRVRIEKPELYNPDEFELAPYFK